MLYEVIVTLCSSETSELLWEVFFFFFPCQDFLDEVAPPHLKKNDATDATYLYTLQHWLNWLYV